MELEQFCILAKTQKGRAVQALIQQVISNKKIMVFGELLDLPSVQALKDSAEYLPSYRSLELFAYGNYLDYQANSKDYYLELNEPQLSKLRQLSLLSLAEKHKEIPYDLLRQHLGTTETRALEDLVIESIYSGLISGKIDQKAQLLRIRDAMRRDVRKDQIDVLIAKLTEWRDNCDTVLNVIASSSEALSRSREMGRDEQREVQEAANLQKAKLVEEIEQGIISVGASGAGSRYMSIGGGGRDSYNHRDRDRYSERDDPRDHWGGGSHKVSSTGGRNKLHR